MALLHFSFRGLGIESFLLQVHRDLGSPIRPDLPSLGPREVSRFLNHIGGSRTIKLPSLQMPQALGSGQGNWDREPKHAVSKGIGPFLPWGQPDGRDKSVL